MESGKRKTESGKWKIVSEDGEIDIAPWRDAESRLAHPSIELAVEDGDSVKPRA